MEFIMESAPNEDEAKAKNANVATLTAQSRLEIPFPEMDTDEDESVVDQIPDTDLERQRRREVQQLHKQMMIKYWRSKSLPVATYPPHVHCQRPLPDTDADIDLKNLLRNISKEDSDPEHRNLELSTSNTSKSSHTLSTGTGIGGGVKKAKEIKAGAGVTREQVEN